MRNDVLLPEDVSRQRLLNLGALSVAVAHDVNNILSGVAPYLYLLQQDIDTLERLKYVQAIDKNMAHASELSREVMSYSRGGARLLGFIDPVVSLREIAGWLSDMKREGIELTLDLPEVALLINISQTYFRQIFLNLFFNAQEAIDGKGWIRVTGRLESESSGKYFLLEVEDSGCGIPPENLNKLFSPFFSTKSEERVGGFGLSIIKKHLTKLGGRIEVSSILGKGALFSLYFPLVLTESSDLSH